MHAGVLSLVDFALADGRFHRGALGIQDVEESVAFQAFEGVGRFVLQTVGVVHDDAVHDVGGFVGLQAVAREAGLAVVDVHLGVAVLGVRRNAQVAFEEEVAFANSALQFLGVHGAVRTALGIEQQGATLSVQVVVFDARLALGFVLVDGAEGDSGREGQAAQLFRVQVEEVVANRAEVVGCAESLAVRDLVLALSAEVVFQVVSLAAFGAEEGRSFYRRLDVVINAMVHGHDRDADLRLDDGGVLSEDVIGLALGALQLVSGLGDGIVFEKTVERGRNRKTVVLDRGGVEVDEALGTIGAVAVGVVFRTVRDDSLEALIVFQVEAARAGGAVLGLGRLGVGRAILDGLGLAAIVYQDGVGVALDAQGHLIVGFQTAGEHLLEHAMLLVRGGDEPDRAMITLQNASAVEVVQAIFDVGRDLGVLLTLNVRRFNANVKVTDLLDGEEACVALGAAGAVGVEVAEKRLVVDGRDEVFHAVVGA